MGPAEPPAPQRVEWERAAARPARYRPATGRGPWVALLVATVLVVAALVVASPGGETPQDVDPYAVDQVAQRYRALGSSLLADALTCAPLAPRPGQAEAVTCSFGTWTLLLVAHADPAALAAARAAAAGRGPDVVRWAVTEAAGATAVLSETAAGASSAYWDATAPRPVSATASAPALPLPDLLVFVRARGSAHALPDLPGPAFRSGALWALAEPHAGASCRALPAPEHLPSSAEEVRCTLADGVEALFVRDRNAAEFERTRASFRLGTTAAPGTLRSGTWDPPGARGPDGLLLSYVYADEDVAQLYADDPASACWVLLRGTGGRSPDELRAFWESR